MFVGIHDRVCVQRFPERTELPVRGGRLQFCFQGDPDECLALSPGVSFCEGGGFVP